MPTRPGSFNNDHNSDHDLYIPISFRLATVRKISFTLEVVERIAL